MTDFDLSGLSAEFAARGFHPAQAPKVMRALYAGAGPDDLERLSLGKNVLACLAAHLPLMQSRVLREHESVDGTVKLLVGFNAPAGGAVEAVLMPAFRPDRAAGCISSQVGCAMGCDFCASTKHGLSRNLEVGEMVEQFLHLRRMARDRGRRLATLVFMGMGEPLHNLANVIAAIGRIAGPGMGELGGKQITVSTVGLVPQMDALAEADLGVHLALSLHAPDDATRSKIVPANRRWPVAEVMAAAQRFEKRSKLPPNIEYCMLDGVNDFEDQARLLAELMKSFRAHVNLIPHNWIGSGLSGIVYRAPPAERVEKFLAILRDAGIVAHVRRPRGDDVNAACGQLRETAALA